MKKGWFALSQTEGDEIEPEIIPEWDQNLAIRNLEIEIVPFDLVDGNVQGYSIGRKVAISPIAQIPIKTLFHEMGHVLLGHTDLNPHDETLPRSPKEVEAESVAYLCLSALGLKGGEYCRGYIQGWIKTESIPEKSAQKIMNVADKILKAGRGVK